MAAARLLTGPRLGVSALALLVLFVGPVPAADEDAALRVAPAPYRGTVVDEQTGRPLPLVAVIILWQRLDEEIQGLRRLVAACETFTDEKGEFVHDVAAVERRLSTHTFAPRIIIFRPGYVPLPDTPQLSPPGVAAARFAAGAEVRLAPTADREDRTEAFNTFIGMLSAAQLFPPTGLPETAALIRDELESLDAKPIRRLPSGSSR